MTTGRRWLGVRLEWVGVPSAAAVLFLLHPTHCLLHHFLLFVSSRSYRCSFLPDICHGIDAVFPACLWGWQRGDAGELLGGIAPALWSWWCQVVRRCLCLGRETSWIRRTRGRSKGCFFLHRPFLLVVPALESWQTFLKGNRWKESSKKGGAGPTWLGIR